MDLNISKPILKTRRDAISMACGSMALALSGHSVLGNAMARSSSLPAQAKDYGEIIPPAAPQVRGVENEIYGVQYRKGPGHGIVLSRKRWSDEWIGFRATGRLNRVDIEDALLARYGPFVVMRGSDTVRLNRVWSEDARISKTYGIGLLRASGTLGRIRVTNTRFIGSKSLPNSGDPRAVFCLQGKRPSDSCSDWELTRFHYENCLMARKLNPDGTVAKGSRYLNADGVSVERGHVNGLIENGFIKNVSDAGIDCKGNNCRINQVEVHDARESFKLWGASERHGRLVSKNPGYAHIIALPGGPRGPIVIDRFEAFGDPDRPVVQFENGARDVVIRTLIASPGQKLFKSDAKSKGASLIVNGSKVL